MIAQGGSVQKNKKSMYEKKWSRLLIIDTWSWFCAVGDYWKLKAAR